MSKELTKEDLIKELQWLTNLESKRDFEPHIFLSKQQMEDFKEAFGDNCGFSKEVKVMKYSKFNSNE